MAWISQMATETEQSPGPLPGFVWLTVVKALCGLENHQATNLTCFTESDAVMKLQVSGLYSHAPAPFRPKSPSLQQCLARFQMRLDQWRCGIPATCLQRINGLAQIGSRQSPRLQLAIDVSVQGEGIFPIGDHNPTLGLAVNWLVNRWNAG